jgi:hypothetical protein
MNTIKAGKKSNRRPVSAAERQDQRQLALSGSVRRWSGMSEISHCPSILNHYPPCRVPSCLPLNTKAPPRHGEPY